MTLQFLDLPLSANDGHRWNLAATLPPHPHATLLWLPALGVAARHYRPWAEALAARDIAVFLHEWRGNGSSSLRASRKVDWGYREILSQDLPASLTAMNQHCPGPQRLIGGHSLGGQLAACFLGMQPDVFARLWLVASGTPDWRSFPAPMRYLLPGLYQFTPWLADRRGALPGRKLGFGGEEARTLIRDWARVGLSGRYAAAGVDTDLEAALAKVKVQAQAVVLEHDRCAPARSTQALLGKLPQSPASQVSLQCADLGIRADHFAWMKRPAAVVDALLRAMPQSGA